MLVGEVDVLTRLRGTCRGISVGKGGVQKDAPRRWPELLGRWGEDGGTSVHTFFSLLEPLPLGDVG